MIRSLSVYLAGGLLASIFSAIVTFLLTRTLSPAEYGQGMLFVSSFWCLFFLCSPGMNQVLMRYFYEAAYRQNTTLLLYRCLFFVLVNTVFVAIVLCFFQPMGESLFHYPGLLVWVLLMVGALCTILLDLAGLIPRLLNKPVLYNIGQILNPAVYLLTAGVLLSLGLRSGLIIVISQLSAMGVALLVLIYCYRKIWAPPKSMATILSCVELKRFMGYGFPFIISSGFDWLFFNLDKFLLLKWSNYTAVGIYTAAFILSSPLDGLKSVFTTAWVPRCHQLLVEKPFKGKKEFHETFHKTLWAFTAIGLLLLSLKPLLVLFLGEKFRSAGNIFGWLLLAPYFFGLSEIVVAGILKSQKTYWNIIISILSVMTNVICCYFLIPPLGAIGAAISCAASFFIFFIVRQIIAFQYYAFKIFYGKLIAYPLYLCFSIWLTQQKRFYLPFSALLLFLIFSFLWLEKKWLIPLFYITINKIKQCTFFQKI